MKRHRRFKRFLRNSRGSALLVSLMVIVGLSMLGLGFVAISETETAIAKNQQNVLQTQAIAEAGAKVVVEWFQDPVWGQLNAALPANNVAVNPNLNAIKVTRVFPNPDGYTGVYKPLTTMRLFDKPYRPDKQHRLYGDENTGDIVINSTTDLTTINNFNTALLGPNPDDRRTGEVTEIRVYAPPIVGGTLITNGAATNPDGTPQQFWSGGERYGVATIKVTAQQFRDPNLTGAAKYAASNILSTHNVRLVVGEIPLPIPGGPIQSNTAISFGGDFIVHWGNETSTGDLDNKRNPSSLPWANAYDRPHFEHGYEPGQSISQVIVVNGGSGYAGLPLVTIGPPAAGGIQATANATVSGGSVTAITMITRGSLYSTSFPPTVTFAGGGGAGAAATAVVGAEAWPRQSGATFDNANYFNELIDKTYEDPWFGSRCAGDNTLDGGGGAPQCYPYSITSNDASASNATYSFQYQDINQWSQKKKVLFPSIKYDFWKRIAQTGRGYKGIYYFKYDGSGDFTKFGAGGSKPMAYWANSLVGGSGSELGPGVYFFDTRNGKNPQLMVGAAKKAELTPSETWNSADYGGSFLMEGFVYVNAVEWGSQGMGSSATKVDANFPGEVYRDIGYPVWNKTTSDWERTGCAGQICRREAGDGRHSFDDLNNNGKFDVVTQPAPAWTSYDPGATNHGAGSTWVVKTWKSNPQAIADYGNPCTIPAAAYNGTNPGANDCSEPHEPYLNMIFPASAGASIQTGWEAPGSQTFRPKEKSITCGSAPAQTDCTSNAYDLDGALVPLDTILYGILFNEGDYNSQGNATYYGSVLIQGVVGGTGTPDIWFDEKLIKGTWAPPNMPRVVVFNEQTDEQQQ
ncbi:MAG: pilus assembly PilX N-terminal domain-containing protein [Acidobacteriota bacterium]